MAKDVPFKAYDLQRRNLHKIPDSPAKISQHRVDKREWAERLKKGTRKVYNRKVKQRLVTTAATILREGSFEVSCLHCGRFGDDSECGFQCYKEFGKDNFPTDFIDIRGPGPLGYAAYTKPGVTIKEGQWIGEYIGELHPIEWELGTDQESMYKYVIPKKCVLDAEKAGNWTRFINSHCDPNLFCRPAVIGKRAVVLFQARRNIGPEEELTFSYGSSYFRNAGFACKCSTCEGTKKRKKVRKIIAAL